MAIYFILSACSFLTGYTVICLTGRNKLHAKTSFWWLSGTFSFGITCLFTGFFSAPLQVVDENYLLLFLVSAAICCILRKRLFTDMAHARQKIKLRRLIQHRALLRQLTTSRNKKNDQQIV
ncbi:MAG: DUF2304 family protein [Deltaproteobacteria bacterium]|nr:DUF2304 family protein [Deltaproteobacteria bacterium]